MRPVGWGKLNSEGPVEPPPSVGRSLPIAVERAAEGWEGGWGEDPPGGPESQLFFPGPPSPIINTPFCTAIILYYKLALFPDPGQRKHARKTQNHTHTKMGRFFFSFSLSPGCVLSVQRGVGGCPGPG